MVLAAGGMWMLYEMYKAPIQQQCMQCGAKIKISEFFCNEECNQQYRNEQQHYETKDFE